MKRYQEQLSIDLYNDIKKNFPLILSTKYK